MLLGILMIIFGAIGFIICSVTLREKGDSFSECFGIGILTSIIGVLIFGFIFLILPANEETITFTNENILAYQKGTKRKNGELILKNGEHYSVENDFQIDENIKNYVGKYCTYSSFEKFFFIKEDTAMRITSFYDDSVIL